MTKPYTVDALSDCMSQDFNWRLKEFSDLKAAIKTADSAARHALLRALIALTYAHWEGFVKVCATSYFEHITARKLRYSDLEGQIYKNTFLVQLDAMYLSRASITRRCEFLDSVLSSTGKRFSRINPKLIDTKSNLNSDVLHDLCTICGISFAGFEEERSFIDVMLLRRRNKIAHGEVIDLGDLEIGSLVAKAIVLMRLFRNLLENKAYEEQYRA